MRACPQCKQQFSAVDEFCPHHGVLLVEVAGAEGERLLGTTLDGRYELTQILGEGGMGRVYRARHTVIEKPVAVKILKREVSRDGSVVKRFLQEAKAASRIGHANIVDVTDFGTIPDGTPYCVMEFIDGLTLSRVLRQGPMTAARALPIVAQLCRALAAAHEKGIVHRDLKPENIFLVERDGLQDFVKIVDFGIAKVAPLEGMGGGSRLTRVGSVFGTPEYMAPEQAAGKADTDRRVDVYAVGTILYEMLVGRVPHKMENLVATLAAQMLDTITPPLEMNPRADITPFLQDVIMKALAKEREERYSTMHELLDALEDAGGGIPLEPLPATGSSRGFPRARSESSYSTRPRSETPFSPSPVPLTAAAGSPTVLGKDATGRVPVQAPSMAPPAATMVATGSVAGISSPTLHRKKSRRLALAAGGITLVAAATLAIALVSGGGAKTTDDANAIAIAADARRAGTAVDPGVGLAGERRFDAGVVGAVAVDAGSVARPPTHVRPAIDRPPPPPGALDVVVKTIPAGGDLFEAGDAAGSDGTTFHRARGTRLDVRCTKKGYEPGRASFVFDGKESEVVCKMKKKPICKDDLKNPFDDCP